MKSFHDPETYTAMLVPFRNHDAANAALDAFWEDLQEIRKKHQIADVHVVLSFPVKYSDGQTGEATWQGHLGSSLKAAPMIAYALGQEQAAHREMIAKLLAGGKP